MTEPPNPWATPPDPPEQPENGQQAGWGNPPVGQPPQWGLPADTGWGQSPYQQTTGNDFSPPPGWAPVPPARNKATGSQIAAGIAAWFGVNITLAVLAQGLGEVTGLLALAANVGFVVVPAVKGHKGFAIGFALGFVVAFVLALGACFLLLAGLGGAL